MSITQAEIDYTNGLIIPLFVDAWAKIPEEPLPPEPEDPTYKNLNNWDWYGLTTSKNKYTSETTVNNLNLITSTGNYEKFILQREVEEGGTYTFSFDAYSTTGYIPYSPYKNIICGYISDHTTENGYPIINEMLAKTDNIINYKDKDGENIQHYECSFIADKDMVIYYIIDFSEIKDNAGCNFIISNININEKAPLPPPPKKYKGYLLFQGVDVSNTTYTSQQRDINGLQKGNYWLLMVNPAQDSTTYSYWAIGCEWCKCNTLEECMEAYYSENVANYGVDHSKAGCWAYTHKGMYSDGWDESIIPYCDKTYSFRGLPVYNINPHEKFIVQEK